MKLVRFGPRGRDKPGIIDSKGAIRDLSKVVSDIAGEALSPKGLAKIRKAPIDKLPLVRGNPRLGACVGGIGNLIAIGLNYSDHAAETGAAIPKEPIIFNKVTSCICGPNDDTMSSSPSSSASARATCRRTRPWTWSPVIASPTTFPSACSKSSAAGSGSKARALKASARSARG